MVPALVWLGLLVFFVTVSVIPMCWGFSMACSALDQVQRRKAACTQTHHRHSIKPLILQALQLYVVHAVAVKGSAVEGMLLEHILLVSGHTEIPVTHHRHSTGS